MLLNGQKKRFWFVQTNLADDAVSELGFNCDERFSNRRFLYRFMVIIILLQLVPLYFYHCFVRTLRNKIPNCAFYCDYFKPRESRSISSSFNGTIYGLISHVSRESRVAITYCVLQLWSKAFINYSPRTGIWKAWLKIQENRNLPGKKVLSSQKGNLL